MKHQGRGANPQHQATIRHACGINKHLLAFVAILVIVNSLGHIPLSWAQPTPGNDLSLGLTMGRTNVAQTDGSQQFKLIEQIMSDDYTHDFELSIRTLNQLGGILEEFVRGEQIADQVGKQNNLMTLWANRKGGSSFGAIVAKFDFILSTFWAKFKPLIEAIVTQRPDNLGPNDLDFRCKRANELKELKEMGSQSSIYSMYLDTFFSELYIHCLLRKLALIRNNKVAPSPLLKQFVEIYLEGSMQAASRQIQEQGANQILAHKAIEFNIEIALAQHGSLSNAAQLVIDPRTTLSMIPDPSNVAILVKEFESDCLAHNAALGQVWADFESVTAFLTSETSNLVALNERVKLVAPQLVYGSICSQLLKLPH